MEKLINNERIDLIIEARHMLDKNVRKHFGIERPSLLDFSRISESILYDFYLDISKTDKLSIDNIVTSDCSNLSRQLAFMFVDLIIGTHRFINFKEELKNIRDGYYSEEMDNMNYREIEKLRFTILAYTLLYDKSVKEEIHHNLKKLK